MRTLPFLVFATLCASACGGSPIDPLTGLGAGVDPPLDRAHYPLGLALHPTQDILAVVSSNYDLRYGQGAVLLTDLRHVRVRLQEATGPAADRVVAAPYYDAAFAPSFGGLPLFTADGRHLLLPSRAQNQVGDLALDDGVRPGFACSAVAPIPCVDPPTLQDVSATDPYSILVLDDGPPVDGLVTFLSSPSLYFFKFDGSKSPPGRMVFDEAVALPADAIGVRGLVRVDVDGVSRVFGLMEAFGLTSLRGQLDLISFDPQDRGAAVVRRTDLTSKTGAGQGRALAQTTDGALLALLRRPDALARIVIDVVGGVPVPRLSGLVPTCEGPTGMALATVATSSGPVERAVVTCFDSDAVAVYDARTLVETDLLRFYGRGPTDVVVDRRSNPPEAYVSFFLDDSVGVFALAREDGSAALVPRGRLTTPRPPPEDGR